LLYAADDATTNYDVTQVYLFVGLCYLVLTVPLSILVNVLERRWGASRQGRD
jgi:putative glutamine transport system permease protein